MDRRLKSTKLCADCVRILIANIQVGLDSWYWDLACTSKGCAGGRRLKGIILVDGNRKKLKERIKTLVDNVIDTH